MVGITLTMLFVVTGCNDHLQTETRASRSGHCITRFDPRADYFPDKISIHDATNFSLTYHNSYQLLTVNQPYPQGTPETYVLVHCGAPDPELTGDLAQAQRVTVPVTNVYSASITHVGMLSELDKVDVVAGMASTATVVNAELRRRIAANEVAGYAPGLQVNTEAVIAGRPDALITQGLDDVSYPKLRNAGIPVVAYAEWLETTPLGRAEWVKVFGALTGTEKTAENAYQKIRDRYHQLTRIATASPPVQVLPGAMYHGTWSMPTGADYAGRLLADGGGTWAWANTQGRQRLELSIESVYAEAGQAPLWMTTAPWRTLADVVAEDTRYSALAAVRNGQVWSATAAASPGERSDYWERSPARPDLLLGDVVAILDSRAPSEYAPHFYRQVRQQ